MTERPTWCPDETCLCLASFDENICVGRLIKKEYHEPLWNTHRLCEGPEAGWAINRADAYYYAKLMAAVIKDVDDNRLYDPAQDGLDYGFSDIIIRRRIGL